MNDPEIILNLWFVYDNLGMIYSLRARAYIGRGSEAEKLALLKRSAGVDYLIAHPFPIPKQFHTTVVTDVREETYPVVHKDALAVMGGPSILFEDTFRQVERMLPAQTQLSIGKKPLVCITPLYADEDGHIYPAYDGQTRLRA